MGKLSIRLSNSLDNRVRRLAEKVSTLMTGDYLAERAARGDRKLFEAALRRIPDVEPREDDFIQV